MTQPSTLGELLAQREASTHAVTYIDGRDSERRVAYPALLQRALGLLHYLQQSGAEPGGEVVLLLESNEQFVDAFWACMLGGLTAVPLSPGQPEEHRARCLRVIDRLHRPHLCTDSAALRRLASYARERGLADRIDALRPRTVVLDRLTDLSRRGEYVRARPEDLALVQFSSGSTSTPKGVMLSHRNLIANLRSIVAHARFGAGDSTLGWMPLTHDMGLIGFHLVPLYTDIDHWLMPTGLFARRPLLWLRKVSEKRASLISSPNFGYRVALRALGREGAGGLDLACVRLIFNGAEPISASLAREFLDRLAVAGLRPESMYPVYGLAEAGLAVAFPEPGSLMSSVWVRRDSLNPGTEVALTAPGAPAAVEFVQEGRPLPGCEVRIAGEDGAPLADGHVGRIRIRGDNVTRGYYGDAEQTRAAIDADGWLDTGDLGFVQDGVLTVTGRAKDILFVNGQNYYPHDLEGVVERQLAVEPGRVVATGVGGDQPGDEDVVLFVQHRAELADFVPLARAARAAIAEHLGLEVSRAIPVARIPRTTSGKLQRYLLADALRRGEFDEALHALAALDAQGERRDAVSEVERALLEACSACLGGRRIGPQDNVFELGVSSLALAQIHERIDRLYPGQLEVTDFFDYPTIGQLAAYLATRLEPAQA
jgi:acyl-CoA synthetase (AMP-forming)/AMP-acid ligase II